MKYKTTTFCVHNLKGKIMAEDPKPPSPEFHLVTFYPMPTNDVSKNHFVAVWEAHEDEQKDSE